MSRVWVNLIRPGALGDTILSLPTAAALKAQIPHCSVRLIGGASAEVLQGLMPDVDESFRLDAPAFLPLFMEEPAAELVPLLRKVLRAGCSLAFLRNGEGLARNWHRLGGGALHVLSPVPPAGTHVSEHLWSEAAGALGLERGPVPPPRVRPDEQGLRWARSWLDTHVGRTPVVVCVHPGSGGRRKCWTARGFAALIDLIERERDRLTVLVEGPADAEACGAVAAALGRRCVRLSNASVRQVSGVLALSEACVSNDSGIAHLSAALDVPTVAVFTTTDAALWAPRGRSVRVVGGGPGRDRGEEPRQEDVVSALDSICGVFAGNRRHRQKSV
jgi:ADP-heptose:LPS heptosyltransferase